MKHLRSRLIPVVCAGFMSVTCVGQTAPSFNTETSASGPTPLNMYAVDVNNDGFTDIIQDNAFPQSTGNFFAVSVNNGNGTFQAPVNYKVNSNGVIQLTWGDFNNDGKVDIAVAFPPTQIAVYLGNGDGTFQAPITTTLDLPSGSSFASFGGSIVAADFNHDGNKDLVVAAYQGSDPYGGAWAVYLAEGDGNGHFVNPRAIYYPTSGWTVQSMVTGDFDTDGNADVVLDEYMNCPAGTTCPSDQSNIVALFGDGSPAFEAVDVTTVPFLLSFGAADLNNDGATDLYGVELGPKGQTLAVFPGHYDRRFSYYYTPIPASPCSSTVQGNLVAADFNGTGKWALAGLSPVYPSCPVSSLPTYRMIYFLSAGTPNVSIAFGPGLLSNSDWQFGPLVGNFNGDQKPDIAVNQSAYANASTTTLAAGLNNNAQGFYGGCNYPSSGQGIRLCSPSTSTTSGPLTFAASANSFGQLRKIELWVDGVKLGEDHWTWGQSAYFDLYDPNPSSGTHSATIYAADIDNTLQRYDFTFTAK